LKIPNYIYDNVRVIKILTGLSLAVMSFGTFFSAYLRQGYTETLSFRVEDGWCDTRTQGFGIHCFGDFYAPISIASESNPWDNNLNLAYTPVSFSYFRLLNSSLFLNIGSHVPLLINFLLTLAALLIPGFYIWRNQKQFPGISGKWVALISVTAAPSLMMIDRGSSSFLLFPAVFFFFLGIQRDSVRLSTYTLIIMAMWKPQTLILAVGLLIVFGLRPFLVTCLKFGILFSASFLLYPTGLLGNVSSWLQNSKDYQNYAPNPSPGNYSFVGFVGYLDGIKNLILYKFESFAEASRPLSPNFVTIFCTVYALIVVLLFIAARNSISKFQFTLHSSIFMLTIPGTTFGYYLALMLIPILLTPGSQIAEAVRSKANRLLWCLYILFLVITVPAWPINWGNLPFEIGDAFRLLGVQWTIVHFLSALLVIVSLTQLSLLAVTRQTTLRRNPDE